MCSNGLGLETSLHLFSVTYKNILLYGCNALHISRHNIIELDKLQAKLIKNILGIHVSHRIALIYQLLIGDTVLIPSALFRSHVELRS